MLAAQTACQKKKKTEHRATIWTGKCGNSQLRGGIFQISNMEFLKRKVTTEEAVSGSAAKTVNIQLRA